MKKKLNKNLIERYSRQIVLKDIGTLGQKKIFSSKILIVGAGGLGSPVAEFLTRAGVGTIGIVDNDKINLSNLHRQSLYGMADIGKNKVFIVKKKLNNINKNTKVNVYNFRLNNKNFIKIINKYDLIVDGSDNFKTKFLLNEYSLKYKKFLIVGAISKMDGHIFTFNFKNKKNTCLKCFYQSEPSDEILNCEYEGILGPVAGIVGNIQAMEVLKKILNLNKESNNKILILNLFNLNFRKVQFEKKKRCICKNF